ncbi:MAG: hypothetical protein RLZZ347_805 [Candidatus Parcubacteria bacterium]|jgi:hypothetical protein
MSWSSRRQTLYIGGIGSVLLLLIGLPLFLLFYHPPSCFDGKKNQDEAGVDCGGVCQKICPFQIPEPIVKWARSLSVQSGVYNAVAYIENPNVGFGALSAPYIFRIYDKDGLLISERKGQTFVPPGKVFAIFEPAIDVGERIPERTLFEFTQVFDWQRMTAQEDVLFVAKFALQDEKTSPRLEADIANHSVREVGEAEVVALVFDTDNNVIGFSRTTTPRIAPQSSTHIVFTWPKPFGASGARVEIIPRLIPSK